MSEQRPPDPQTFECAHGYIGYCHATKQAAHLCGPPESPEQRPPEQADPLPSAMLHALHERHAAPPGFDSRAEDCDTCKRDASIAVTVANSPAALQTAIGVVNVEGEKYLDRERWKELRAFLIELAEIAR